MVDLACRAHYLFCMVGESAAGRASGGRAEHRGWAVVDDTMGCGLSNHLANIPVTIPTTLSFFPSMHCFRMMTNQIDCHGLDMEKSDIGALYCRWPQSRSWEHMHRKTGQQYNSI